MFSCSPLLKAVPDWSTTEPAMTPTRTCLVCGAGTVMPDSSYCFTHFRDEPAQEAPAEAPGQPATEAPGLLDGKCPEEPEMVPQAAAEAPSSTSQHC